MCVELIKITIPEDDAHLIDKNVSAFADTVGKMTRLYSKKNHDYGNSFEKGMTDIGIMYGVGRLYDKMNRIVTLSKTEAEIKDESIQDTLLDLACYAVMNYNFITGKTKLGETSYKK